MKPKIKVNRSYHRHIFFSIFIDCKNSGKYEDTQCSDWIEDCFTGDYVDDMLENCRKTCGFCDKGIDFC